MFLNLFLTSDDDCRSYVNTNQNSGQQRWREMSGTDKFGFVVTGTNNEAMIKLLSMVCVFGCYVSGARM